MRTSDKNRKLTPLEELRLEKAALKQQCLQQEKQIISGFSYVYNNLSSLTISTIIGSVGKKVGLIQTKKEFASAKTHSREKPSISSTTVRETVMNGLKLIYPIARPIVYSYVIDKIKGVFIPKKKKRR